MDTTGTCLSRLSRYGLHHVDTTGTCLSRRRKDCHTMDSTMWTQRVPSCEDYHAVDSTMWTQRVPACEDSRCGLHHVDTTGTGLSRRQEDCHGIEFTMWTQRVPASEDCHGIDFTILWTQRGPACGDDETTITLWTPPRGHKYLLVKTCHAMDFTMWTQRVPACEDEEKRGAGSAPGHPVVPQRTEEARERNEDRGHDCTCITAPGEETGPTLPYLLLPLPATPRTD